MEDAEKILASSEEAKPDESGILDGAALGDEATRLLSRCGRNLTQEAVAELAAALLEQGGGGD